MYVLERYVPLLRGTVSPEPGSLKSSNPQLDPKPSPLFSNGKESDDVAAWAVRGPLALAHRFRRPLGYSGNFRVVPSFVGSSESTSLNLEEHSSSKRQTAKQVCHTL